MDGPAAHPTVSPPWRLVIFMLATAAGVLGLRLALLPLFARVSSVAGLPSTAYVVLLVLSGGLLIGHLWTFRIAEPRGWSYVGLGRAALRPGAVGLGLLLGAAAIGIPSLALLGLGWLRIQPAGVGDSLGEGVRSLAVLVPAALWEELLLRGYFFAVLREVWGSWRAILVTSVLFGLLHWQNAGATAQSVALVTLAGVFLGSILLTTGSLYAVWAAHLSWNLVMAVMLHAAVSGIGMSAPNYRVVDSGPDWATGGAWGPEGGLFAGLGMTVALFFLYWRRHGRGARRA